MMLKIVVTNIVNPASLLSGSEGEQVIHDCLETIEATYSSHLDVKNTPLEYAETWFTDHQQKRTCWVCGYHMQTIANKHLCAKAEIIA
ncbi:hypothetical protein TURU_001012 [Turdus rufiventris]|nr:hypothetical protein TURU_001012 [Turdus rufiventris]